MQVEVGVIGCVHGDVAALDAVLAALDRAGVCRTYQVGDLFGEDAGANAAIVARLQERGVPGVFGPIEAELLAQLRPQPAEGEGGAPTEVAPVGAAMTIPAGADPILTYVETLPRELRFEIGGLSTHLFHGSPRRIDENLGPDTRDLFLAKIGRRSEARILVYGHSHRAYWRAVGDRFFMDVGSVTHTEGRSSYGLLRFGRRDPTLEICTLSLS